MSSAVFILTKRIKLYHLLPSPSLCGGEEGGCQSMTRYSPILSPGNNTDTHQPPHLSLLSGYFYIFLSPRGMLLMRRLCTSLFTRNAKFRESDNFWENKHLFCKISIQSSTVFLQPVWSSVGWNCVGWDESRDIRSGVTGGAALGIVSPVIMFCWLDSTDLWLLVFQLNVVLLLIVINTYLRYLHCWQQI